MAFGYLVTKFLILIFFIPIFLMMKEPIRKGLLTVGLILLGYLPFIVLGADVLMPFTSEVGYRPVGSNPWVMIDALGITYPWYLPHIVLLLGLAALSVLYITSDRLHYLRPESTIVLFSLIYMLFGKKSFSFYIPFFLVFIVILFMRLYAQPEHRKVLVSVFLAYLISFSLLYQSVVVLKMMQVTTIDWLISTSIYIVAVVCQVLLIWIIIRFQNHESDFHYYRIPSLFKKPSENSGN
jgi:hypothetical protein